MVALDSLVEQKSAYIDLEEAIKIFKYLVDQSLAEPARIFSFFSPLTRNIRLCRSAIVGLSNIHELSSAYNEVLLKNKHNLEILQKHLSTVVAELTQQAVGKKLMAINELLSATHQEYLIVEKTIPGIKIPLYKKLPKKYNKIYSYFRLVFIKEIPKFSVDDAITTNIIEFNSNIGSLKETLGKVRFELRRKIERKLWLNVKRLNELIMETNALNSHQINYDTIEMIDYWRTMLSVPLDGGQNVKLVPSTSSRLQMISLKALFCKHCYSLSDLNHYILGVKECIQQLSARTDLFPLEVFSPLPRKCF